ncbi:MAG: glycosyltransferase, partial [Anaerolineae bacterium]|nr:glycosyltransferase [Anaerolineae bacterium]
MPSVSVVVPSYQQGKYIRATLDSVLSQNYRGLECIVMDG